MRIPSLLGTVLVGSSLSLSFFAVACSSSSDQPAQSNNDAGDNTSDAGSGTDATVATDGGADIDAAAVVCNDLTLDPGSPTASFTSDPFPTGKGGTLPDGTYVLESGLVYGTTSTTTIPIPRQKIVVTGTTIQIGAQNDEDANKVDTETDTISVTGNTVSITETCPKSAAAHSVQYSVEDGSDAGDAGAGIALILYTDEGPGKQAAARYVKK